MNKIKFTIVIFITGILFLLSESAYAQNEIQIDSSNVSVTYFEDNIQERYSDSDFNYDINDTGGINLIQILFRKLFGWLGDIFGINIDFINYQILEIIIYSLLAIGALYLLIKFLMESPPSSIFRNEEKEIEDFNYIQENVSDVDFEKLISSSLKNKNYRLATRFLYLKTLKILSKNGIIEWHYDKTNSDYINEITDETIRNTFKRISYIYDYVWYGEFDISADQFNSNRAVFNKLKTIVNG